MTVRVLFNISILSIMLLLIFVSELRNYGFYIILAIAIGLALIEAYENRQETKQ